MDTRIAYSLSAFSPISLAALNSKAAMLTRLDRKYIIPADQLRPAMEAFQALFDVLEIDGERSFTYATVYFDDADLRAYHDHHQGRRRRSKIRVRQYLDAGLTYLEVKLKDKRDVTVKRRLRLPHPLRDLDTTSTEFIDRCHVELYDEPLSRKLRPVIAMRYERMTLVAREGGERMTLDTAIEFTSAGRHRRIAPEMFIVETKSARGNGIADAILRGLHLRPTKRCSKYCIGMAAMGRVERANRFLPALRRLHLLPVAAATPSVITEQARPTPLTLGRPATLLGLAPANRKEQRHVVTCA